MFLFDKSVHEVGEGTVQKQKQDTRIRFVKEKYDMRQSIRKEGRSICRSDKKLISKSIDEGEASMEAQTEYWKLGNKFTVVPVRLIN